MRAISMYRKVVTSLFAVFLLATLAGCGAQSAQTNAQDGGQPAPSETNGASQDVKVIGVGTMGTYYPFSYVDDQGRITGFDIEVLREVEKRIDGIRFDFKPTPWDSMFLGLEAGKYQVVANQITRNPEREQKYLFTDNSYFTCQSVIVVKKGRKDIRSMADLHGKTVGSAVGDSFTKILEDYNQEHNHAINIKYYDGTDPTTIMQDVAAGRIDAYLNDPIMVTETANKLGIDVEIVEPPVDAVPSYFVFRKDDEGQTLKDKVDQALAEMIQDGTLSKMSIEWFGKDYTKVQG